MPTVPNLPPEMLASASPSGPTGSPPGPANLLMAAAELHQQGALSAPVPTGHDLQTGKARGRRAKIQVVK